MKNTKKPNQQAQAERTSAAKRVFVTPKLERQDRLPEITGFSF